MFMYTQLRKVQFRDGKYEQIDAVLNFGLKGPGREEEQQKQIHEEYPGGKGVEEAGQSQSKGGPIGLGENTALNFHWAQGASGTGKQKPLTTDGITLVLFLHSFSQFHILPKVLIF